MSSDVGVIIVTHNSAESIGRTLAALEEGPELIVVDNASGDSSADLAEDAGATVIRMDRNDGFGAGCHAGASAASGDVLVFLNPDAIPRQGWLPPLIDALEAEGVGAAMATIELADRPGHFNTSGGELTYFGLAWVTELGEPISEDAIPVEVPFPSGAAMAISRRVWDELGGFRPELFLYQEDADLGWRLRLAGMRSVRVPLSRVAHEYAFGRNPDKFFYLERNRVLMLMANYRRSTLALLAPALCLVELGMCLAAARDGWLGGKLASWRAAWRMRDQTRIAYARVQSQRIVGDAAVLSALGASFTGITNVDPPVGSGMLGAFLAGYRRMVLPLVRRADRRLGLD